MADLPKRARAGAGSSAGGSRGGAEDGRAARMDESGPLAFMAKNPVAANLLMVLLLAGGIAMLSQIKREVFPEFELDLVLINVAYPGASPEEVEQGVVLAVEEAVRGLDDVKEVRSTAREGVGSVSVELLSGTNTDRALSDIKAAVDRITSFPVDAERPVVSLAASKRAVLSLLVYGDVDEKSLRTLAEETRAGLLLDPNVTVAELSLVRPLEIGIEVSQENLRRYGLTLEAVADAVRRASVEIPAGGIKTGKGEVLLRMTERRDLGVEFENIVVLSRPDGSQVRLSEIATIDDGFRDTDQEAFFNGKRAAAVEVFRIGEEGPIEVSQAVHDYVERHRDALPPGVAFAVWNDRSEVYKQRQDLLLRNAYLGLALVLLVLGLFLEIRLAFWVTLGIPISFAGSLLFLPWLDLSLNMISLFAFIVTLGLVVDDAIVVGEAVHKHQRDGMKLVQAAIAGAREVAAPVTFSILTTIIAFTPLLAVPGVAGKFFRNIPLVVIAVLAVSLIESLYVLPAHLAEGKHVLTTLIGAPFRIVDSLVKKLTGRSFVGFVVHQQQRFSDAVEWFIQHIYAWSLQVCLRWRYATLAFFVAGLVLTVGLVAGGRVQFTFLPKIDSDVVQAQLEMPVGTPVQLTRKLQQRMLQSARETLEQYGGEQRLSRGILSEIGTGMAGGVGALGARDGGGHLATVRLFLLPGDQRDVSSRVIAQAWRERLGDIAGPESRRFRAIFLTTLSTVGGLTPLIMEKDMQARFLIPMAISIAAGVAFATILTLVLIPSLLGILNDLRRITHRITNGFWAEREA
ncbi:MAG: efflux RND transporter permease subunit, partial [Proteobacteria bacterium]|nr:efflux RND transporter permease subunit [Pseudomonadota bacterium]